MVAAMTRLSSLRRVAARHPRFADALLAAVLVILTLIALVSDHDDDTGRRLTEVDFVAAGLAFVLVALRRRSPMSTFAVSAGATIWFDLTATLLPQVVVATMVCAYTVASRSSRAVAWTGGALATVGMYTASILPDGHHWAEPENVAVFAWGGMAVAVGDLTRTRRAYVAAVLDRAVQAERSRDDEARRRVIQERLRIARELHDVVAHHIAMINVQAGVAAHMLYRQPEQAQTSLASIRQAARTVLDELSTVLGVLRNAEDESSGEFGDEPTPGLSRLAELLDVFTAAGQRVELRQDGPTRVLPSAVDLAAYRIVQESLTNAQKHGGADRVHLRLAYTAAGVTITVRNTVDRAAPRAHADGGYGLVGMRERAVAIGGTLDIRAETSADTAFDGAGPVFTVHAFLPAPVPVEARR